MAAIHRGVPSKKRGWCVFRWANGGKPVSTDIHSGSTSHFLEKARQEHDLLQLANKSEEFVNEHTHALPKLLAAAWLVPTIACETDRCRQRILALQQVFGYIKESTCYMLLTQRLNTLSKHSVSSRLLGWCYPYTHFLLSPHPLTPPNLVFHKVPIGDWLGLAKGVCG